MSNWNKVDIFVLGIFVGIIGQVIAEGVVKAFL